MLKHTYILFLLLAVAFSTQAQNTAMDLLKKANKAVSDIDSFSVSLSMKVAVGSSTGELLEKTDGTYKKCGANMYTEFGRLISIQKGEKLVFVDNANQSIIINEHSKNKPQIDFDKVFTELKPYIDTVYTLSNDGEFVTIVCEYKKLLGIMYKKAVFKIDAKKYLPASLQLFLNKDVDAYGGKLKGKGGVIITDYTNWNLSGFTNNPEFNLERYTVKKGEKWVGANAFKNYQITVLN